MIPVALQPEPAAFHGTVRVPGRAWLHSQGIHANARLPKGTKPLPTWRACLTDLRIAYGGICAYSSMYINPVTGAESVDHFVAKSTRRARLVYEWGNYRLACSRMNSKKHKFDDLLDPFDIGDQTFHLELVTGHVFPNPTQSAEIQLKAHLTITRLRLDDETCKNERATLFGSCIAGDFTPGYLQTRSPFVWFEANRQGLLP